MFGAQVTFTFAGGLKLENVQTAIREVNPFGWDADRGARTNGHLNEKKLARFFESVEAGCG